MLERRQSATESLNTMTAAKAAKATPEGKALLTAVRALDKALEARRARPGTRRWSRRWRRAARRLQRTSWRWGVEVANDTTPWRTT